jgi:hypothetical protein
MATTISLSAQVNGLDLRRRHVPPGRLALPTESIPGNAPKVFDEIFTTGAASQANGDYSITTN